MKKALIAIGCLTLFASGWAFGQDQAFSAGSSWNALGTLGKEVYVRGYLSGFTRAEVDSLVGFNLAAKGGAKASPMPPVSRKAVASVSARIKQEDWPLLALPAGGFSPKIGQVVGTMDTFYNDYRNAPVCWDDALMFSAASLAGRPPTERVLNNARKAGAKSPCGI